MGKTTPLTIPQAWHQTLLALKKNMYVGSRSAEGVQVILEAICEKIGLDLEQDSPEPIKAGLIPEPIEEVVVDATPKPEPLPVRLEPEPTPVVEVDSTPIPDVPAKPRRGRGRKKT